MLETFVCDVLGGFDSDMCVELVDLIDTCAGFWFKRGKKFVMRCVLERHGAD